MAIFPDGNLTHQLWYKMDVKCSNNQAEQHAIVKSMKKTQRKMQTTQRSHRTAAILTDSTIALEAIANPRKHRSLFESIRNEIRRLELGEWIVNFTWVKAHDNNPGNELADLRRRRRRATTAYKQNTINIPNVQ